jgi:hypothetical protein
MFSVKVQGAVAVEDDEIDRCSSKQYKSVTYGRKDFDNFAVPTPGNIGKANYYVKL